MQERVSHLVFSTIPRVEPWPKYFPNKQYYKKFPPHFSSARTNGKNGGKYLWKNGLKAWNSFAGRETLYQRRHNFQMDDKEERDQLQSQFPFPPHRRQRREKSLRTAPFHVLFPRITSEKRVIGAASANSGRDPYIATRAILI